MPIGALKAPEYLPVLPLASLIDWASLEYYVYARFKVSMGLSGDRTAETIFVLTRRTSVFHFLGYVLPKFAE